MKLGMSPSVNKFVTLVKLCAVGLLVAASTSTPSFAQSSDVPSQDIPEKRIFGIIPNFRSSQSLVQYEPLTPKQKFKIATDDSFDRGTIALAALFGAQGQLAASNPSFGQGVAGFSKYFATSYGDYLIGDMMTEAVFPILLHQDPRYFRRGSGSTWSRLGHSVGQIVWTVNDSGRSGFNYSEIGGNATAVAISNAYYPDNRSPRDAVSKLGTQIAVDMASNILKEFGPDLTRRLTRKRNRH